MDKTGLIKDRRVLPRWREVEHLSAGELRSASKEAPFTEFNDDVLKFYYDIWQKNQTLENALEVICHAQLAQDKSLTYGPAEQILKAKNIRSATRQLAEKIRYNQRTSELEIFPTGGLSLLRDINIQRLHSVKGRLEKEAGNGFLWLELSRLHSILGNDHKAYIAALSAFKCSPNNRLILRSGARFLIHQDKTDEAHRLLKNSDAVQSDPWVQAAEISVASLLNKKSNILRQAKNGLSEQKFSPIHLSELAAAIGTEELIHGSDRNAKRFFAQSLVTPTENTVAQAFWAKKEIDIIVGEQQLSVPRAYEAIANAALHDTDYKKAADNCLRWYHDEPFSSSPAVQGTFIMSGFLNNQAAALDVFNFALHSNPHDKKLLNNGIVSLAKLGQLKLAEHFLEKLKTLPDFSATDPTYFATFGLVEYRKGNFEEGALLYNEAINMATRAGKHDTAFRAKFHGLEEEVEAGLSSAPALEKAIATIDESLIKRKTKIGKLSQNMWSVFKKRLQERISVQNTSSHWSQLNLDL